MSEFADRVAAELRRARELHKKPINSPLEGYGVIAEELDEYFHGQRKPKQTEAEQLAELIQIGAMAQRAAEDLGYVPKG